MIDSLAPLFESLSSWGKGEWVDVLRRSSRQVMNPTQHGHFEKWQDAIDSMPDIVVEDVDFALDAVTFRGRCTQSDRDELRASLMEFHPWRKGPFELFGLLVDAEWRSNLKWARIRPHVELDGRDVLDVGCGNGYYGWRMLGEGARCVVGLEPYPLYVAQHAAIHRFSSSHANYVVPANDQCLDQPLNCFDTAFSMGVLYHSKDPLGHLQKLRSALKPGGTLVLETLVVDGDDTTVLLPAGRYAKMRNVWLLPSTLFLERALNRIGFRDVAIVDTTATSTEEQRRTDWMTFESLRDFLDQRDSTKTVEGEPAPTRATFIAHA